MTTGIRFPSPLSTAGACALVLACAWAPAALAGSVFTTLERDAATGKVLSTTILTADNGKLLVENLQAGKSEPENAVIFKDGGMILVDHGRKSYADLDRATLQSMAQTLNKAMKQLEESMAGLSPEQKAAVAKMMGSRLPDPAKQKEKIELRDTGRTETVAGHTCRLWEVLGNGQVRWQHCVVDPARLEGAAEMLEVMKRMSTVMEELAGALDSPWAKELVQQGWEGVNALDGYPILTRSFSDGKPDSEMVLESSRSAAIAAARFEPPAGYKKRDMRMK